MSLSQANAIMTQPGSPFELLETEIRGVKTRVWKNGPTTLRDVFLVGRSHGDKPFLIYEDDRVSYAAFSRAATRLAHELMACGVTKGDRVAIAMRNLPEFAVAFFGAALAGAIVTPLNAWWTAPELHYGIVDSGARVAIMDAERLTRVAPYLLGCVGLQRIYVCRAPEGPLEEQRALRLEDTIGPPSAWGSLPEQPLPDVTLNPEDDASIFYTSGTTGLPKGALGTHRNAVSNIMAVAFCSARVFVRRGDKPPDANQTPLRRATLLTIPMFHTTASLGTLVSGLFVGGALVLMRRWAPELALQLIEREKCTAISGVPTIAWQLLEHPSRSKYDLSSLEGVFWGGAPAAPELVRLVRDTVPQGLPGSGWGMTETSAVTTNHIGEDYVHRPDSAGPPTPVCDLKVTGPSGETLPAGEVGELWVRGPNVVKGYWNDTDATSKTFVNGWVRTGDLARLDDEGFLYILDRVKDIVIRGGENVYCVEVENALYEHPAVIDAAVVAIAHRTLGEEPGAVVTLKQGAQADEDELKAFVGTRLAAFKVPARIVFWPEPLPRNPAGKILKRDLKKLFD
jgi:long-chain acyl-CoA synthetase